MSDELRATVEAMKRDMQATRFVPSEEYRSGFITALDAVVLFLIDVGRLNESALLRSRLNAHADHIAAWRTSETCGMSGVIELMCDAEDLLRVAALDLTTPQERSKCIHCGLVAYGVRSLDPHAPPQKVGPCRNGAPHYCPNCGNSFGGER